MNDTRDDQPHHAAPSLWPIGFAIGIACILVGLIVSVPALIVGALVALVFGYLWVRDLMRAHGPVQSATVGADAPVADERFGAVAEAGYEPSYDRSAFLSGATIGVGAVIGAAVTLPSLGFAVLPSFTGEGVRTFDVDLGPISNFPQGKYVIATFAQSAEQGDVSRRTAYVRNNGFTEDTPPQPSFTIVFSRCVHLGCPVQANGPVDEKAAKTVNGVELRPVLAQTFGCPCHGGQYDSEGNRTAGPPVRSLDRFEFSIRNGNLVLGRRFSVGTVEGTGANARITKYYLAYPGVHVDGPEQWLYPIPTPGST